MLNLLKIYCAGINSLSKVTCKTGLSFNKRMAMYRMLEKMTAEPAALQINDAMLELQTLENKKGFKSRLWYVFDDVLEQMRNSDAEFSAAIGTYIPGHDAMILAASEQDDITLGFSTLITSNIKTKQMKSVLVSAIAYPAFLITLLLGIIYYFSTQIIPSMLNVLPQGVNLSTTSKLLITLTQTFNVWFSVMVIFLIGLVVFSLWALPNLTHRARKYLENLPPFNMYRIVTGCGFLFALNSLTKAGFQQIDALEQMERLAKPYLRYRLLIIMDLMADGMDMGQALVNSELNFPDKQMVRELAIQIKYGDSDDSLEGLSHTLADDGLAIIRTQAKTLNTLITMSVFAVIGFLYSSIYALGQEIAHVQM